MLVMMSLSAKVSRTRSPRERPFHNYQLVIVICPKVITLSRFYCRNKSKLTNHSRSSIHVMLVVVSVSAKVNHTRGPRETLFHYYQLVIVISPK